MRDSQRKSSFPHGFLDGIQINYISRQEEKRKSLFLVVLQRIGISYRRLLVEDPSGHGSTTAALVGRFLMILL